MSHADVAAIASLDTAGTRGPAGWIEWNLRNYKLYGFGLWVIETPAGQFVGDCGLTRQEVDGEWFTEVGWHVLADLRGQGYAPEAAKAVLHAAAEAGMKQLIAIIRPENSASRRVAEKIGMQRDRQAAEPPWANRR